MMSARPRSYPPQMAWIRVCNISYSYIQANFRVNLKLFYYDIVGVYRSTMFQDY